MHLSSPNLGPTCAKFQVLNMQKGTTYVYRPLLQENFANSVCKSLEKSTSH